MTGADSDSAAPVTISGISQRFGATRVLEALDLQVGAGETVALLGPSGCGKTTLLRLVAGLATPTAGSIRIGGRTVVDAGSGSFVPPEAREIGMVFQDYALWPHMSVAANVAFPLDMRGIDRAERQRRVLEALALVGLEHLADRPPGTLSGGQQQRVALARAIIARPPVILFDEPLSNLDRELRESLVFDIAGLLRRLGMTGLYVTHDHGEAFAIADRIAIMNAGRVLQLDAPEALVARPNSPEVAAFLKLGIVIAATMVEGEVAFGSDRRVRPPAHLLDTAGCGHLFVPRTALTQDVGANAALNAVARYCVFRGDGYSVQLDLGEGLVVEINSPTRMNPGETVNLAVAWEQARWFPEPARSLLH